MHEETDFNKGRSICVCHRMSQLSTNWRVQLFRQLHFGKKNHDTQGRINWGEGGGQEGQEVPQLIEGSETYQPEVKTT